MQLQNPISAVDLPGISDILLQGLIVVVGPNSSGKTQFLHDLNETICGRPRQLVVASAITYKSPPPFNEYFEFLLDRGNIRESGPDQFFKRSFQYGTDEGGGSFRKSIISNQYKQFLQATQEKAVGYLPEYQFLKELGPMSCSALFLKNRLSLMDSCQTFDHLSQGPTKTLQSLYWNKNAKSALFQEISQVFQRAVWVDNTRHNQLVLRVSDSNELPDAKDRLEPEIMEKYRIIETEGDGLRSYAAICATLLLEQRPLCLIDEPEMCLHPPQAYAMGRFIGEHAITNTGTIVATHSSHVLKGILETNRQAKVIRLTRTESRFQARTLATDLLEKATSKPRSRSEAILEGLLSQAVVLCEAAGDRIVYESVYRTFKDRHLDIRFTPSEGTGGFADPLKLYKMLQVPTVVIADLDFMAKDGELKKVLSELEVPDREIAKSCKEAREAIKRIRDRASHINPVAIQEKLKTISQTPIDLIQNEDKGVRRSLQRIISDLSRLRDLQQRGLEAIPEIHNNGESEVTLRKNVKMLLSKFEEWGLFLVPVGELESWLPILMKGHSRNDKSQWAMLAAEKIEDVGERDEDVWHFILRVYDFLDKRLKKFVNEEFVF